jgi:hypothetical protein
MVNDIVVLIVVVAVVTVEVVDVELILVPESIVVNTDSGGKLYWFFSRDQHRLLNSSRSIDMLNYL